MLSLLLITALAVQTPQTSKPSTSTTDSTTPKRSTTAQRGTSQSAIARQAFHDRMRELWTDHSVYTRSFIVSATAGLPDTAEVSQRLMRNQDEIGEAIKPYYGDAAGSQLASLLRNHIQLAAKTFTVAKSSSTAMNMQNQSSTAYVTNQYSATTDTAKHADTVRINSQYPANPDASKRGTDTTQAARSNSKTDTTKAKANTYGTVQQTTTDSTHKDAQGNAQVGTYAQGQMQMNQQAGQVDSTALNAAIADLKANGDSIAAFFAKANPRGFSRTTLSSAIQMRVTLLLKEATAQINKDWSGSIAAYDESQRQVLQMADLLSDGIMKQFPSRFTNKATAVSSR